LIAKPTTDMLSEFSLLDLLKKLKDKNLRLLMLKDLKLKKLDLK